MSMLQVRNLSENTHQILRVRAVQAGQSLSDYVAARLDDIAATPTLDEVLERIKQRTPPLGEVDAASVIRAERDARS
ncbi:MAG: hypothetical protein FWG15_08875 [Propionibacteriaceae bacterium]|nr:hypothetical protein [Propionibacteriaceae bacterium]